MIPEESAHENLLPSMIQRFFQDFQLARLLKQSNIHKDRGISPFVIFQSLFTLVFSGKSLSRLLDSEGENPPAAKDAYYRFLNSTSANWRKFLWLLAQRVISFLAPLTSEQRVNVLIVDDTLYSRSRSQSVELLARVYDHVSHRFVKGFRMLTLGWSDGNSFVPLAFSLLSSEKAENRLGDLHAGLDKRSNGWLRRKEAMQKSTDVLISLLEQAKTFHVPAKHVLFDSWFAFPKTVDRVVETGFHVVAMLKNTPKVHYRHNGQMVTLAKLYASLRKRPGKAKILTSALVEICVPDKESFQVRIVFVRDRNRSRNWLGLLSTDLSLSEEEVVRLYGKRWDIEVFFKVAKSHLRLAKEFQCRSYDAQVAHTTIVFARYLLLSVENRCQQDERTLGGLFYACCDEMADIRISQALAILMEKLAAWLNDITDASNQQIQRMLSQFIACLPSHIKENSTFLMCET